MKDFWEEYSNGLEDDEFRRFYRMDKSTFKALTSFLNPKTRHYQGGHLQVRPHKMVAMTLFFFGQQVTILAIEQIVRIIRRMFHSYYRLCYGFTSWESCTNN